MLSVPVVSPVGEPGARREVKVEKGVFTEVTLELDSGDGRPDDGQP